MPHRRLILQAGLPRRRVRHLRRHSGDGAGRNVVHEAAGSDYVDSDDFDSAYAWLNTGLKLAMSNDESRNCIARLQKLRRLSMTASDCHSTTSTASPAPCWTAMPTPRRRQRCAAAR
jgi:hypothetical protein